jgi:probable phosphoglycerate mutase
MQAIYSSPLERAFETAEVLAEPHGLRPAIRDGLGELRFGDWEGQTFDALNRDPKWARFNETRSLVCPPGGEPAILAQSRIVQEIDDLLSQHSNETVALVSHLDPLRALVAHCLGMPLDFILRFDISPASVSRLSFVDGKPLVSYLNQTAGPLL